MAKNSGWLLSLAAGVIIGCASLATATAATVPQSAGGITISPFQQQFSIAPDDSGKNFTLSLTNHTGVLQELTLTARDFGTLNDTGGILFEGSTKYTQKYGLTSWISLGADTVVLQPGETRAIPVAINNRSSLQPGGHYGAIVASVTSLDTQRGNRVAVNQQLVSLVLVDKVGGEHFALKLNKVTHDGNWIHLPKTVKLRFQNPGNVHVTPRGTVQLKSPSGAVVAQGIINSESAVVLPESYRELYVPLQAVGKALPLPGLYHIDVDYRYEGLARTAQKRVNLQFIDLGLYVVVVVVLFSTIFWFTKRKISPKKTPITD